MEALSKDYEPSSASMCPQNDENNNQLNICTDNMIDETKTNDKIEILINLLKTQLCSSCGREKATVVCTGCTSQVKTSNLDSIPALKVYNPADESELDDYYQLNNTTNVDKLLQNGNMVYCNDCFEILHYSLDRSKHVPIDLINKKDLELHEEEIKLIVEDKIEDLIGQIELKSKSEEEYSNNKNYHGEIQNLINRTSQFNDVKQSIRQMNDIIRDDLYLDFGTIANIMENKLEEISDRIKEKLKDAYSVVRDLQNRINEKINAVEYNLKELETLKQESWLKKQEISLKESEIATQIQQINEELKSVCEPNFNFNSCHNSTFSCSLFVDNNLYPQFNYHVDLSKVISAINDLNVQIGPSLCEPKPWTFHDQMYLDPEFEFDALINSGIQTDGSFWVQFLAPSEKTDNILTVFKKNKIRSNQFLEELSRYIRSKIICDKDWLSYAQLDRVPQQDEKCFCLDQKTRKWYRAKILKVLESSKECHVLFVDTGYSDLNTFHSFENLLPWRDFDLAKLPNRAIKTFIYNKQKASKYEDHIFQETKFLFKDLTAGQPIKCVLIEPILTNELEEAWICKIYKINEDKKANFVSINSKIIEQNKKESNHNKDNTVKFSCTDIRLDKTQSLQSANVSKSSPLSSSSSFTPANPNSTIVKECKDKMNKVLEKPNCQETFSVSSDSKAQEDKLNLPDQPFDTNLEYSSVLNIEDTHQENIDIEDQTVERRFYKNSFGMCNVTTSVSSQGIFWIRPFLKQNLNEEFDNLSKLIGNFIRRTNYRSYGDLKIDPETYKKCFVRTSLKRNFETTWYRGFVEKVFKDKELCRVRLMDNGNSREVPYSDIYPHRRLNLNSLANQRDTNHFNDTDNHGLKLNYLAIRCCLFKNSNYSELSIDKVLFNNLISSQRKVFFNLIEQVYIGRIKCWYTEISVSNDLINKRIFNCLTQSEKCHVRKSKSENIVNNNSIPNQTIEKSNSIQSSDTNREWIPVEINPVNSQIPRSNSMYDLKEPSSQFNDTLDDTNRSIKVKSDFQSTEKDDLSTSENSKRHKKNRNRKNKYKESMSLPHQEIKSRQFLTRSSKSLLIPVIDQKESISPFKNEPEWEVNPDYVVQQPAFVSLKQESNTNKKNDSKKSKSQCKPQEQFFDFRHDEDPDRRGNRGGKFDRHQVQSRGKPRGSNEQTSQNYKNYRGRNHVIETFDEDQNSSALNDVFLNNNDDSSLDQDDLDFDVSNEARINNNLNSSPNSPYQKLFKVNPQLNSYEQVLSRISENDSVKNVKIEVGEDAEKIRSLNITGAVEHQANKIDIYDTSLDTMPRLIIEDDDNDNIQIDLIHGTILDQTHQIPNRHIINDLETNRSIKTDTRANTNYYKNRSYSAADVALIERNRLNLRPIPSSTSSSSTSSSSLTELKKKIIDEDEDESFASCPEEIRLDREDYNNVSKSCGLKNGECSRKSFDEKKEKMKKFTISIFVDDFEADSSKTLSNDSSNGSVLSMSPKGDVEQLRNNLFTVRNEKESLEEFEKNEILSSFKRLTADSLDEDVFMFTSNPTGFCHNRPALASKPPLMPAQLSTIVELSQECSNNTEQDLSGKKNSTLEDKNLTEIDSNSNDLQRKIDFYNEFEMKNVTIRRHQKKSKDYDFLNECRKSRSASSISDNCQIVNSLSNNCLINESIHLSHRLNVTLESYNSRPRTLNNSVLITDQLFEKFCVKENDLIMNANDENKRIQSLNDFFDETTTSSLPQRSSSSPDISSYTTDSLFNSHLIITPICSELVSPNQACSVISRSPQMPQSTPNQKSISLKSPASQSSQSSSLPPPPHSIREDESNTSALPPAPPNSFPPAPHFQLIKLDKTRLNDKLTGNKSDIVNKKLANRSNSNQNLVETTNQNRVNKHINNYLDTVRKSTGVELQPVRRPIVKPLQNEFKSANFSLYGLDDDDDQEIRKRSLSEGDSADGKLSIKKIFPSLTDLSEPEAVIDEPDSQSFKFPPPPDQFNQSDTSTLPPPPEQKDIEAMIADNNQNSNSSSSTTVIQQPTNDSPRLKAFLKSIKNLDNPNESSVSLPAPPIREQFNNHHISCPNLNENNDETNSFKLDHLLDINPKRLYKNSKFRCRIHDVISESGKFWIEVIYAEEDERKFQEIFKLFNLCARISEAPKLVYKNQRVAALYKGDWYRALVIDNYEQQSAKVKVRFLDLGLEKLVDKLIDLRSIDEKFFNCPLKALKCSIYIDEEIDQIFINNQLKLNDNLKLNKDARKYFVKMVYKKILFAKIIDFVEEIDTESQTVRSICKIKLGCQAHCGIIDVYMYLLSKFNRKKYEFLKELKNYIQSKPVWIQQESIETTTVTTTETTSNTVTSTSITGQNTMLPSPPDSLNVTLKRHENIDSDDSDDECSQIENEDEEIIDQEEDYEESEDEDDEDDVLFPDAVNYYYAKNVGKDNSLDLTPVKDSKDHKLNYADLKISPVDLPDNVTPLDKITPNNDLSTAKISNRLRATANARAPVTPIALPPAKAMSEKYVEMIKKAQNCSSDIDVSLTTQCCTLNGLKKWAKSKNNQRDIYEKDDFKEMIESSKVTINKKVKFQIK